MLVIANFTIVWDSHHLALHVMSLERYLLQGNIYFAKYQNISHKNSYIQI